ncbi:MAG: hypothetical protein IPN75_15150 [Dechloromonas sp.]|uniref:Uncharacterized protein n=1 Tax=Candidatus Dechloromonas phosphorivorans TaxID=2899244 RepID=A0A9D7LPJ3_9RHOO|nr:hypothetical protein [Candidatus Dechloromonas phosphorivorans]
MKAIKFLNHMRRPYCDHQGVHLALDAKRKESPSKNARIVAGQVGLGFDFNHLFCKHGGKRPVLDRVMIQQVIFLLMEV